VKYGIKFTPEAEDTYEAVVSQLLDRWGEKFVLRFSVFCLGLSLF